MVVVNEGNNDDKEALGPDYFMSMRYKDILKYHDKFNGEAIKMEKELEKILAENLSRTDFIKWKQDSGSEWGKTVARIPFGKYNQLSTSIEEINGFFNESIVGRDIEKAIMMRKIAYFLSKGGFRRPLLLVGNPGEGKSFFAKCLAESLGFPIKYVNIPSLNSPLALCGSEQHYSNSRVGEIIQAIIDEQTLSLVFVFDEIDKSINRGDDGSIESVLLALFDPVWNKSFVDRSLNIPVDLSRCIFICTANKIESISEPLADRMDVIRFEPYSKEEILNILIKKTIPKTISDSGMGNRISFASNVATCIIESYDFTSMREYEKVIEALVDNAVYNLLLLQNKRRKYVVSTSDFSVIPNERKRINLGFSE